MAVTALEIVIKATENVSKATTQIRSSLEGLNSDIKKVGLSSILTSTHIQNLTKALKGLGMVAVATLGLLGRNALRTVSTIERLSKTLNTSMSNAYKFMVLGEAWDINVEALAAAVPRAIAQLERLSSSFIKADIRKQLKEEQKQRKEYYRQLVEQLETNIRLQESFAETNLWVSDTVRDQLRQQKQLISELKRLAGHTREETDTSEELREELEQLDEPTKQHILNLREIARTSRDSIEALFRMAQYVASLKDETMKQNIAFLLFRGGAEEFLQMVREMSDETSQFMMKLVEKIDVPEVMMKKLSMASDALAVWSGMLKLFFLDIIAALLGINEPVDKLNEKLKQGKLTQEDINKVIEEFKKKIEEITSTIMGYIETAKKFFETNKDWILDIGKIVGFLMVVKFVWGLLTTIWSIISFIGGILAVLLGIPELLGSLIVAAVLAVIAIIAILVKNWEGVKKFITNGLKAIGDAILSFFRKVKEALEKFWNWLKEKWEAVKKFLGFSTEPTEEIKETPKRMRPAVASAEKSGVSMVGGRTQYTINFNLPSHLSADAEKQIRDLIENEFYPKLRRVVS